MNSKNPGYLINANYFSLFDFTKLDLNSIKGSQSPVLMGCGHTICAHCSREKKPCPSCQSSDEFSAKQAGDDPSDGPQFPLNIYVMGMMAVNKSRPVGFKYRDSPDFSFKKSFKAQVNDASNPGLVFFIFEKNFILFISSRHKFKIIDK